MPHGEWRLQESRASMCPSVPVVHFLCNLVTLNGIFDWSLVPKNLFVKFILQGVVMTLVLAILSQFFGSIIGLLLYFLQRTRMAPVRWFGNAYVWFFRGTPLLAQILLFYNLFPALGLVGFFNSINFL